MRAVTRNLREAGGRQADRATDDSGFDETVNRNINREIKQIGTSEMWADVGAESQETGCLAASERRGAQRQ